MDVDAGWVAHVCDGFDRFSNQFDGKNSPWLYWRVQPTELWRLEIVLANNTRWGFIDVYYVLW